jgi:CrcB protein
MNTRFVLVIYAAIGGALGTVARYLLTLVVQTRAGAGFPVATLLINITGSVLLGFLMRYGLESATARPEIRLLLTTGFCGGYTTFSTFSYETARLLEDGEWQRGSVYVLASVVISLVGTLLGFALARGLLAAQRA